ncbi:MAG: hypothetical protein GY899_03820 [Verrucomicrobiaceae bacterium]|nr:hypothetical protein [Verrucomicrobiaceae bacterium]
MRRALCIALVAVAGLVLLSAVAEAGEIIKKTYYDSKGRAVGKYVYQAGSSRRDYSRASRVRYPVHRSGYVYSGLVYSPSLYRVSRPLSVSRGIYHVGWRGYCGYHGVTRHFAAPVGFRLVAPSRAYYRR